ncbi:P-loop containing nucleoside triphosphate hydrolase protein [Hypoxylon rubiginosum]|uniref:P-loop containing nucleoside triphosphate hydrolase protein n=1 Tax=Hypoxylon rubiginosum TaxID=110542 RepID=A0ACC0D0T1_9PEZI|nr:P-loop containing nucleoside triphosphate hydrolase protein [Hypoxylon rubiginosum]
MLPIISLIGIVSSGKRTLGRRLAEEFGLYYFSVGDFFRSMCEAPLEAEVRRRVEDYEGGEFITIDDLKELCKPLPPSVYMPAYIRQFKDSRETIPYDIAIPLLEEKMQTLSWELACNYKYKGILLDGFPRELDHFMAAEKIQDDTKLVIHLGCHPEVARARFARHVGSADDISAFEDRLGSFLHNLPDLVSHLESKQILLTSPNEGNLTIDEAYGILVNLLSSNEQWRAIVGPTYFPLF